MTQPLKVLRFKFITYQINIYLVKPLLQKDVVEAMNSMPQTSKIFRYHQQDQPRFWREELFGRYIINLISTYF